MKTKKIELEIRTFEDVTDDELGRIMLDVFNETNKEYIESKRMAILTLEMEELNRRIK